MARAHCRECKNTTCICLEFTFFFFSQGAFCSLMFGMVLGVTRLILNFVYMKPACGEPDTRPAIIANFHYMYFAILLFWSTTLVAIIVR